MRKNTVHLISWLESSSEHVIGVTHRATKSYPEPTCALIQWATMIPPSYVVVQIPEQAGASTVC